MFISQSKVAYSRPHEMVYDKKFDTAIRLSTVESFNGRYAQQMSTHDDLLILTSPHFPTHDPHWLSSPDCYAKILRHVIILSERGKVIKLHGKTPAKGYIDGITSNMNFQHAYLLSGCSPNIKAKIHRGFDSWMNNLEFSPLILNLLTLSTKISEIIESLNTITIHRSQPNLEARLVAQLRQNFTTSLESDFNLIIIWSERLVCIRIGTETYILPRPYILMIHNKLCDLISVLILATCNENQYQSVSL